jgi:N-hydroxyarylamine O-acetyltransferase
VTLLSARVRFGAVPGSIRPRTHMVLLVTLPEGRWIADVGFGGEGLLGPVPFEPAGESEQFLWRYRIVSEGRSWTLQSARPDGWVDLYAFSLEAHERIDYEVLNHFTATHPRSIFRSTLVAQRPSTDGRVILRNRELTVVRDGETTTRTLDAHEIRDVLREQFGIELPDGLDLRVPE